MRNVYKTRTECLFCGSGSFKELFDVDRRIYLSQGWNSVTNIPVYDMPYNVISCLNCKTTQTKYLGDLGIIYENNHIDTYGTTKSQLNISFSDFITNGASDLRGILEIGACTDALASCVLDKVKCNYYIADPSYTGNRDNVRVIDKFIEDIELANIDIDTIVMSNVFEHIYNPVSLIQKFASSPNVKRIFMNHPHFEHDVHNDVYNLLNSEHIYYVEHQFLIDMFSKHGFSLTKRGQYKTHTVQFHFTKSSSQIQLTPKNISSEEDITLYFNRILNVVTYLNSYMVSNPTKQVYIWPASACSIALFTHGLNPKRVTGFLDNSPNKINKYAYGYNLKCYSFKQIVEENDPNTCIVLAGAGSYLDEISINSRNITVINVNKI